MTSLGNWILIALWELSGCRLPFLHSHVWTGEKSSLRCLSLLTPFCRWCASAWLSWQPCYFCGSIALPLSPVVRLLSLWEWAIFSRAAFCFSGTSSKATLNPRCMKLHMGFERWGGCTVATEHLQDILNIEMLVYDQGQQIVDYKRCSMSMSIPLTLSIFWLRVLY